MVIMPEGSEGTGPADRYQSECHWRALENEEVRRMTNLRDRDRWGGDRPPSPSRVIWSKALAEEDDPDAIRAVLEGWDRQIEFDQSDLARLLVELEDGT